MTAEFAKSWVPSAAAHPDFPLQNLPYGVTRPAGDKGWRIGVAIGTRILDLGGCAEDALLDELGDWVRPVTAAPSLNALMGQGRPRLAALRALLQRMLGDEAGVTVQADVSRRLLHASEVELALPAHVGDYTDFFASVHHATNIGRLSRPDDPLFPNYKHLPLAYHGRSSSIVVSGTPIVRPHGQRRSSSGSPVFALTRALDFELELGLFVGAGNVQGTAIAIDEAEAHLFGVCLLNDWSARDIQGWESQPLGPFLAKNFATSVSPWVVTLDALAPFRVPARRRGDDDPVLLPYLDGARNRAQGGVSVDLEVLLSTARMRRDGMAPWRVTSVNYQTMFWTPAQLVAQHTSNGCPLRPGDLIGSGTVSGADAGSVGSLIERTRGGREPMTLPNGETRAFLEDGDEVTLRGSCSAPDAVRIGLGECRAVVRS